MPQFWNYLQYVIFIVIVGCLSGLEVISSSIVHGPIIQSLPILSTSYQFSFFSQAVVFIGCGIFEIIWPSLVILLLLLVLDFLYSLI